MTSKKFTLILYSKNSLYIISIFSILLFALIYLSRALQLLELFYNSDTLIAPSIAEDILFHNGKLKDWVLPGAKYFFPDVILCSAISLLIGKADIGLTFAIAIVVQFILFLAFTFIILKKIIRRGHIIILFLTLFIILWSFKPFVFPLKLSIHFCVLTSSLLFLIFFYKFIESERTRWLIPLCIVGILSTSSDYFFIIYSLLPMMVTAILLLAIQIIKRKCTVLIISSGLFILFAGLLFEDLIFDMSHSIIETAYIEKNTTTIIANIFRRLIWQDGIGHFEYFLVLFLIIISILLLQLIIKPDRIRSNKEIENPILFFTIIIFVGCCCLFNLSLLGILKSSQSLDRKYLLSIYPAGLIGIPHLFCFYKEKCSKAIKPIDDFSIRKGVYIVLLIGILSFIVGYKHSSLQAFINYYPKKIQCLDLYFKKLNLINGYAGYWEARLINSLSKYKIQMAQTTVDGKAYWWYTSKRFYKGKFNFCIIETRNKWSFEYGLTEKRAYAIFGQPVKKIQCDSFTILVYNKLQNLIN